MSRPKTLLILAAVLVVCCVAYVVTTHLNKAGDEETPADESVQVLTLDTDKITEINWEYEGETGALVLGEGEDGVWTAAKDAALPIDQAYPDAMLTALAEITATRVIEDADLSEYGLTEPTCSIQIPADAITGSVDSESAPQTLQIGNESGLGGQRYLSVDEGNVYIISTALYDAFAYRVDDMVESADDAAESSSEAIS